MNRFWGDPGQFSRGVDVAVAEKRLDPKAELSAKEIRAMPRSVLIEALIRKYDSGVPLSGMEAKTCLSYLTTCERYQTAALRPGKSEAEYHGRNDQKNAEFWYRINNELPTVEGAGFGEDLFNEYFQATEHYHFNDDKYWPEEAGGGVVDTDIYAGHVEKYESVKLGTIRDFDDFNALRSIWAESVNKMGPNEKKELLAFFTEKFELFVESVPFDQDGGDTSVHLMENMCSGIAMADPVLLSLGRKLLDNAHTSGNNGDWQMFVGYIGSKVRQSMVRAGSVSGDEEDSKKIVLTLGTSRVVTWVNDLRVLYSDPNISFEERVCHEQSLRKLLGIGEDKRVFESLGALYKSIKFEEYQVLKSTEPIRSVFLDKLDSWCPGWKNDLVVDAGCGTGWMSYMLADKGCGQIIGVDSSQANLEAARRDSRNSTGEWDNRFVEASWAQIGSLVGGRAGCVLCLGRSLPHVESLGGFNNAITGFRDALAEGGYLVFDMPKSEVGDYRKNVENYRNLLRKMGFYEEDVEKTHLVVDGPDPDHLYNRYVPDRQEILTMVGYNGFEVVKIIEESLPGHENTGDVNVVYVCKKVPKVEFGYPKPDGTSGA